ncbi:2-C-methyl-D-erythritol 2,4-cyclodiphosphate synthase [soil metagenome]
MHAFDEALDRPLVIGGVHIPEGPALAGHSDADVALHALTDALLGAGGAGDLGSLVGVDCPETDGADSASFLLTAVDLLAARGWAVVNVDLTVVAQRPRLAVHRQAMTTRIAELLGTAPEAVSVKATTTDRLGFIGRGEGIACTAVVLLGAGGGSS